jgi:hypothetical protein
MAWTAVWVRLLRWPLQRGHGCMGADQVHRLGDLEKRAAAIEELRSKRLV